MYRNNPAPYLVVVTDWNDTDLSDAMIAEQDPDCVGIFMHDNKAGDRCIYEVWNKD
jgi:hypothetical protein